MLKLYILEGVNVDAINVSVVDLLPPADGCNTLLPKVALIDGGNPTADRVTFGVCELIETTCIVTVVFDPGVIGEIELGETLMENFCSAPTIWNEAMADILPTITSTG
jgi:hypothetical protein